MSHTETQARELWCPMVRTARREIVTVDLSAGTSDEPVVVGGCNTDALGRVRVPASCRCVASECAMWRWGHRASPQFIKAVDQDAATDEQARASQAQSAAIQPPADWGFIGPADDDVVGWLEPEGDIRARDKGYCGLAGRPEVTS